MLEEEEEEEVVVEGRYWNREGKLSCFFNFSLCSPLCVLFFSHKIHEKL